jgi:glycosyltransferase involved in cell wall biosynthesis
MSTAPAVAIVTRTKNRMVLLPRAVKSVLDQRFTDWIHVIVNDGGDPAPVDALVARERARYRDRVRVVHNPSSVGMEAASNVGIRASDSTYVVIHDDDDSWHPDFLAECVAFLERPDRAEVGGVITHSQMVVETIDGETVTEVRSEPFNAWVRNITLYRMAVSNMFPPISFLFRRLLIDEVGLFREHLPVLGDWEFHLRVLAAREIGVIGKPLANYHHRRTLKDGIYANTVVGGVDHHAYWDAAIRNDLLRQDLRANRFGLGMLVSVAGGIEGPFAQPRWRQENLFSYVKDKVYALAQRAKLIDP